MLGFLVQVPVSGREFESGCSGVGVVSPCTLGRDAWRIAVGPDAFRTGPTDH